MDMVLRRKDELCPRDDLSFEPIEGTRETYYRAMFDRPSAALEIFVYTDEAGFMLDGRTWRVFERPDFPSEEDLLSQFLDALSPYLRSGT